MTGALRPQYPTEPRVRSPYLRGIVAPIAHWMLELVAEKVKEDAELVRHVHAALTEVNAINGAIRCPDRAARLKALLAADAISRRKLCGGHLHADSAAAAAAEHSIGTLSASAAGNKECADRLARILPEKSIE